MIDPIEPSDPATLVMLQHLMMGTKTIAPLGTNAHQVPQSHGPINSKRFGETVDDPSLEDVPLVHGIMSTYAWWHSASYVVDSEPRIDLT